MVESQTSHFDFLVIGAGSGGLGAARRAAMFNKKVAMIENKVIGGTCVNVGCVPKKVMFNLANFIEESHVMEGYGLKGVHDLKLDFPTFKAQRDAYIKRLNGIYHTNVKNSNVTYIEGTAKFQSQKEVEVTLGDNKTVYSADHIMIASGSEPEKGGFEGHEHCMVSDNVFELEELPKSMIVVGGGYIAVEMAQIFHALGVQTTLVVRDIPLRHVDQEVVDLLVENMKKTGLDIRLKTPFTKVTKDDENSVTLHLSSGEQIKAEKILTALGRPPCVKGLGLEEIGVKLDSKGGVQVDQYHNTTVPGIYAIGDATSNVQLTPVAIKAGRITAERLFNGRDDLVMSYENIATVIFSHPPIGCVGLTEAAAKAKYGDKVKVYKSKFTNMFYSLAKSDNLKQSTLLKLICFITDDGEEKVVGCHCIGRGVDEMTQIVGICINMGATKKDFDKTVAIHPTAGEEFVLMDAKLY